MNEIIGRFSAILLIGLLLFKVSAFHVYEHHDASDDSTSHCELCVLTIEGQQLEGIIPSLLVMDDVSPAVFSQFKINSFEQIIMTSAQEGTLFSRPPPSTLV